MNPFLTLHLLLVGKVLTAGWRGNITGPSSSKFVHSLRPSPGCWHRASFHGCFCCRHVTGLPDSTEDAKLLSPACDSPTPQCIGLQWRAKLLGDVQLLESQALQERHRDTSPQVQGPARCYTVSPCRLNRRLKA